MSVVNKMNALMLGAGASLALHVLLGLAFIRSASPTFDEAVHLASGYSILATGVYDMVPTGQPPLADIAGALPLLLYKPNVFINHPFLTRHTAYNYGDLFLYENIVPAEKLLNTARIFSLLLWSGLLAFFIWLFASRISGRAAGLASLCVFSLMPVFISDNALVGTDAAAAVLYFAAFCLGYMFSSVPVAAAGGCKPGKIPENVRRGVYAALTGLLTGLAMAAKFSMFVIPPMIITFWIGHNLLCPKIQRPRLIRYIAVYLAAVILTAALVYKFNIGLYFYGLDKTFRMLDTGRSSFVWGEHYLNRGWWFFPLTAGIKTPLAVLALSVAGLAAIKSSFRKDHLWLILPLLIYSALAMSAKVQTGFRQILPVMPFLAVLAGTGAVYARNRKALLILSPLLVLWGVGLLRTGPYPLAYFNELAGGPANGYKFLVDSNLDRGQDLKSLAAWLARRGNPPVVMSYFGSARPEYYGMKYLPLGTYSSVKLAGTGEDLCGEDRLLLAVSAANMQSTYYADKKTYDWLKIRKPVFTAGCSIFLYDLTSDPEGTVKLAELFDRNGMNTEAECLYSRVKN